MSSFLEPGGKSLTKELAAAKIRTLAVAGHHGFWDKIQRFDRIELLEPLSAKANRETLQSHRALVAARVGTVRLIDNRDAGICAEGEDQAGAGV